MSAIVVFWCKQCGTTGFWYGSPDCVYEPGGCACNADRHSEIHVMKFSTSDVEFDDSSETRIENILGKEQSFSRSIPHLNHTSLFAPFSRRCPNA